MNSEEKAIYIIAHNQFMVISTADSAGKPWVSPVGFVYDDDYNLYWVSSKDALHSTNIKARPEVAIVIYGQMPKGNMDGVYVDAAACELTDLDEIQHAIDLFAIRRPQPDRFATHSTADVTGQANWRMYKATVTQYSKRSDSTANGQAITVREIVEI